MGKSQQGASRLARVKEYLAIAESEDSKREAYKAAAEEIAVYKSETGANDRAVATALGRGEKDRRLVGLLMKWRESGYKADTPFLADEKATGRAAVSHTRKVLKERPAEVAADIAKAMEDPEVAKAIADQMSGSERAEVGASMFQSSEARKAAANLDPQGKANLILARTESDEDTKQRNRDSDMVHSRLERDEYCWRQFKSLISPKFLSAKQWLGEFEWTEERVAWMHETGDMIRDAFFGIAAENAQMSEEDFAALLGE